MANLSLLDLPKEILLLIADFLGPVETLNLKRTCTYLHNIFSDKFYWKHWAKTYLKETFPPINPKNARFSWEWNLCEYYHEINTWSKTKDCIKCVSLNDVHYSSIDAVQLTRDGSLCISGSRDRTLALWDVKQVMKHKSFVPKAFQLNAHNGWIWDLYETKNTVYSASWDKTVKIWDIEQNLKPLHTLSCSRTALSVVLTECNLLAVGLYNGTMNLFDPHNCRLVGSYSFHKKPIFEMVSCQNLIFTASQDRRIGIFDLRSWEAVTHKIMTTSLPLSLSVCSELLYVGDSWGNLHLFDSQTFTKTATYKLIKTGRKRQITGIKHCSGSIVISSTDGFIRVYTLTDPPKLIMEHSTNGEAISLDYKNRVIAVGKANNAFDVLTHDEHNLLK